MTKPFLALTTALLFATTAHAQVLSGKFLSNGSIPIYRGGSLTNLTVGNALGVAGTVLFKTTNTIESTLLPPAWVSTYYPPACYITNLFFTNLAAGDHTLFTAPSGHKTYPWSIVRFCTNTSSLTLFWRVLSNGVYYPISQSVTVISTTPASGTPASFILDENESFTVTNTVSGLGLQMCFLVMPTNTAGVTHALLPVPAGQTTIYTVPAGKLATGLNQTGSTTSPTLSYCNFSGGARAVSIYYVPTGYTAFEGTRILTGSKSDQTVTGVNLPVLMEAGNSVVIETDGSGVGETAWFTGIELPAP